MAGKCIYQTIPEKSPKGWTVWTSVYCIRRNEFLVTTRAAWSVVKPVQWNYETNDREDAINSAHAMQESTVSA